MSRLRSHDLREAISNLLIVVMHLQDSLSRFHRPGLHLSLRFPHKLHQPEPSARIHQIPDKPCSASWRTLGRRIYGIPRVFNRTLDPNCDSRVAATIFDVSSPISIGHHRDRTLRSVRNPRNIKIATNDHVARRISQSKISANA